MNKQQARANLMKSLRLVVEGLEYIGIPALKGRDNREPGKDEKEIYEDRLRTVIVRYFGRQRRKIRDRLHDQYPNRKALVDYGDLYQDDDVIAELIVLLQHALKNGISLFGRDIPLQIDWALTNLRASEWARKYVFDLVKGIDNTTRSLLQDIISQFVDTPGMSIGDVMDLLPFDEVRAQRIAVTEITRTYAQANQLAGEDLREAFPGVAVIKIWNTNNDDRVCEICGPLDGKEVGIDENFTTDIANPPAHVHCRCWTTTTTALANLEE